MQTCIKLPKNVEKSYMHLPPFVQSYIFHRISDAEPSNKLDDTGIIPVDFETATLVKFIKRQARPGELGTESGWPYLAVAEIVEIEFIVLK